ncbi:MAG: hypothetical protein AB2690_15300 [Candidatus Thiodiazotropha endolucinida]
MRMNHALQILFLSILLGACGGGGGGGDSTGDNTEPGDDDNNNNDINILSVELDWTPPTSREDDSYLDLSEIKGYRVYYGKSESDMQLLADTGSSDYSDNIIQVPEAGEYYFGVKVYDMDDLESVMSNLKRINVQN